MGLVAGIGLLALFRCLAWSLWLLSVLLAEPAAAPRSHWGVCPGPGPGGGRRYSWPWRRSWGEFPGPPGA